MFNTISGKVTNKSGLEIEIKINQVFFKFLFLILN